MSDQWDVISGQLSHRGQRRRHNEDFVGYFEPDQPDELATNGRLYLIADGVGGAASGELASQYAVRKILYDFYISQEPDLETRLIDAIESANADIFERNNRHAEDREMATTLVAALIHGDKLLVGNVGDSRAYLLRDQNIEQISQDHSQVAQLVREGAISADEAKVHPRRNRLLRSLGIDRRIKVDIFSRQLSADDYIVLCSDGLTRYVSDDEIAQTVKKNPPQKAARRLVELANARGGKDNISVSITQVLPTTVAQAPAIHRQRPELPEWDTLAKPGERRQPVDWSRRRWLVYTAAVFLLGIGIGLALLLALSLSQNEFDLPEGISALVGAGVTQTQEPTNPTAPGSTPVVRETLPSPSPNPGSIRIDTSTPDTPDQPVTPSPSIESPQSPITSTEDLTENEQPGASTASEQRPACISSAVFVDDLIVRDGEVLSPGQPFEKVWLVKNNGTCPWGEGYRLSFIGKASRQMRQT